MCGDELVQLHHGCRRIILLHLFFHQFLYFICYLRTSPATWTTGYGLGKLVVFKNFDFPHLLVLIPT